MAWIKTGIFAIASLGFLWGSREALRNPRKHGYYRFFAFESILALILINFEQWFVEPFSGRQLISWALLAASLYLAAAGFYLLKVVGKPEDGIEDTTVLVKRGVYEHIRHPLYASLIAFGWGVCLKDASLPALALAAVNNVFLYGAALVEEGENLSRFGEEYEEYRRRTKMFVPYAF
ncbi:MAG: isoprenylcysteine carboxylmethyltransferase family protein [Anaerolineae bacterium]|nr:isoprenylcysteine carboxylmethyltransferase family protein [Anaerolineae bacterium]